MLGRALQVISRALPSPAVNALMGLLPLSLGGVPISEVSLLSGSLFL